jgi:long-chain acyl-CoA synthetase
MDHPWDRRLGVWYIAEDQPDTLAVLASPQGTRTYAELVGNANQLVHTFRSLGLTQGSVLAAMLPNGVDLIEVSLACQQAGWLLTPLNTALTQSEVDAIIEHSGAELLVVHEKFKSLVTGGYEQEGEQTTSRPTIHTVSIGSIEGIASLESLRSSQPTTTPLDRSSGALFPYSSGTTGKPKGVRRAASTKDPSAEGNIAALFGRAFDFRPFEGPHLVTTAMYHVGSHAYYMGALHVGHGLIVCEKFDAEDTLQLIDKYAVTTAYMVPTQFVRLLRLPAEVRAKYNVSSLHSIVHSAAPCPRDVKEQMMAWWGPVIWETYGGTEGAATIAKPQRWLEKPGTVGRTVRGVEVVILDDEGKELPSGEIGQIYMQTEGGFSYHADADGTKQAFRGKRFTIGDVGYLDADGYLFISDRIKDMVITGGVNVYPAEIEGVLHAHPAVDDVAVIGVPDAEWGESIKAIVQLAPGITPNAELEDELIEFCRARLASFKCPRTVDFRDELPRTDAGKLYKRRLRDEYWAASERQV